MKWRRKKRKVDRRKREIKSRMRHTSVDADKIEEAIG